MNMCMQTFLLSLDVTHFLLSSLLDSKIPEVFDAEAVLSCVQALGPLLL